MPNSSKTFTFFWGIDIVKKDVHAVVCWLFAVGKIAYSVPVLGAVRAKNAPFFD